MENSDKSPGSSEVNRPSLESLISDLLNSDSERYEEQAKELIDVGFLEVRCGNTSVEYSFSENRFCYSYKDLEDGSIQEGEILSPLLYEDQIHTLKFIFAQSEAEVRL